MADFEKAIEQAIADGDLSGCVLFATNRDETFTYNKAFGVRSLKQGSSHRPMDLDTIMWTASCTKLPTSICCAQLVERGLITYDEPIYTHIPELKDFPLLKGFKEDGSPIEEPHKKPITLRTLLLHTCGFTYETIHPLIIQWMKYHGKGPSPNNTVLERFSAPMIFEPGESWMYGAGLDLAGLLLERITGKTLEEYMKENLWAPLGIKDMTFFLSKRPDLKERMADMSVREEDGKLRHMEDAKMFYTDGKGNDREGCMGGDGVFTSAKEYIKILHAVLVTDTNEKILKKETAEELFRPQLGEASRKGLELVSMVEPMNNVMGGIAHDVGKDWGLGGMVIMSDMLEGKKKGTMFWGGLPNLTWFVDRNTGLCGMFAAQVLPPGDTKITALVRKFEAGMYELCEKRKSGSSSL